MWLKPETRTEKLFIPQNSQALKDLERGSKYFSDLRNRNEAIILIPKHGKSILSSECFQDALVVHKAVINLELYSTYCATQSGVKASSAAECMSVNALELFNYNETNMINITRVLNEKINSTEVMSNGRPAFYNFARMFGKLNADINTAKVTGAGAMQLIYFMKDPIDDAENLKVLQWEKTFIDKMMTLQNKLMCSVARFAAERSLDDAIVASSGSDFALIATAFTLMISFSSTMLGKFKNPLMGHSLLANVGILAVGLGVISGFGLCLLAGSTFVSIVGVLPFLVLSIGIDDMFIFVDELDRQDPQLSVVDTVKKVMRHSGPTVTMTTITDLVAFAVSTSTAFPAIKYFCTFAATSITLAYLFIVTFFIAFVTFDIRRMKSGRRDCLPFCRAPNATNNPSPWYQPQMQQISNKVMDVWGTFLMRTPTKIIVVFVSIGLLAAGIVGALNIDQQFDRRILAPDGSHFKDFVAAQEDYFSLSIETSVIIDKNTNYADVRIQNEILQLTQIATKNSYYQNRAFSWLADLQSFVTTVNQRRNSTQTTIPPHNMTYLINYFGNCSAINESLTKVEFSETIHKTLNTTAARMMVHRAVCHSTTLNITFSVKNPLFDNYTVKLHSSIVQQKLNMHMSGSNFTATRVTVVIVPQLKLPSARPVQVGLNNSLFIPTLKMFLSLPEYRYHTKDVKLGENSSYIRASRVILFMKNSTISTEQRDAMLSIRRDIDSESDLSAYPIARPFMFFEQYAITLEETVRNLAVASATILVITWPFLADVTATLLVFFGFVALVIELFGLMYIWDVALNSVSMINLVMAIGFSVDYSAHVAHAYVGSTEETPERRAVFALRNLGASVLMGGRLDYWAVLLINDFNYQVFLVSQEGCYWVGTVVNGLRHLLVGWVWC